MMRFFAIAFALTVATSAQALSPPPLHQPDGMYTQARVHHGVAVRQARRCLVWGAGHVCRTWG
jgi:hypothetical protein